MIFFPSPTEIITLEGTKLEFDGETNTARNWYWGCEDDEKIDIDESSKYTIPTGNTQNQ